MQSLSAYLQDNEVNLNQTACSGGFGSATSIDFGFGTQSSANTTFEITHTKRRSDTDLIITGYVTAYATVGTGVMEWGVRQDQLITNPLYSGVGRLFFNDLASHRSIPGMRRISGVSAGAHQWKPVLINFVADAPHINVDANDVCAFSVREVAPSS